MSPKKNKSLTVLSIWGVLCSSSYNNYPTGFLRGLRICGFPSKVGGLVEGQLKDCRDPSWWMGIPSCWRLDPAILWPGFLLGFLKNNQFQVSYISDLVGRVVFGNYRTSHYARTWQRFTFRGLYIIIYMCRSNCSIWTQMMPCSAWHGKTHGNHGNIDYKLLIHIYI